MTEYVITVPKSIPTRNFILGIAEKPTAAKQIANALSSSVKKFTIRLEKRDKKDIIKLPPVDGFYLKTDKYHVIILSAFGHLFTLQQNGIGWQFPVYDFYWTPVYTAYKGGKMDPQFLARHEATVESFRYLANLTTKHMIMTDYDEEGEVIGALVLSELVNKEVLKKSRRMRYSTFDKTEIQQSFKSAITGKLPKQGIDFGMLNRGLMRHYLDWLWGINLSRALMLSLKNSSGKYHTLSTGRVQGPTLSFVSNRIDHINSFVPIPRFKIDVSIFIRQNMAIDYSNGFIDVEKKAKSVIADIEGENAIVADIVSKRTKVQPPVPYNLSSLQNDAYRHHKLTPSRTLQAAEKLYLSACISYPRTSSEKYPPNLDHHGILNNFSKSSKYKKIISMIKTVNKTLNKPKEGKKKDPAHPCIYPTGNLPTNLRGDAEKIYEMITRRYFATFGKPAEIENTTILFKIASHDFHKSGKRTISKGWRAFIGRYDKFGENEIPKVRKKQEFKVISANYDLRYTTPPARYNQSTLLKEMEKTDIGTKATRSEIIRNLYDRKFLNSDPIEITPVGDTINEVLERYSPQVISVDLSRKVEKMGDLIQATINQSTNGNKFTLSDAIVRGITYLHVMLEELMDHQLEVGELINRNLISQRKEETIIDFCRVCKTGKLKIIRSIASGKRFVGCSNYFKNKICNVTYALPQKGNILILEKKCKVDGFPQLRISSGKRPWTLCLNPECPLRKEKPKTKKKSKKVKTKQ